LGRRSLSHKPLTLVHRTVYKGYLIGSWTSYKRCSRKSYTELGLLDSFSRQLGESKRRVSDLIRFGDPGSLLSVTHVVVADSET
jgi:hypothetical protein